LIGTLEGGRSVARASTIFESDASPPTPQCRRYPRLFEPLQIGSVGLRNRLFKTAAESCFIDASGGVEPALLNYYESIAAGGVGLVIVESPTIDFPISMTNFHGIRLDEDRYVDGLARLADVIHRHQCPAFVQLHHAGPWHLKEFFGLEPISVSATRECELPHFTPAREITLDEIAHVVGKFADAAERVKAAGFDGVEINAAASHLLGVFLSRAWNRRSDEYGPQDLESRSRIVRQIIQAIKQRNGPDFPVTLIMNGLESGRAGSMTLEESRGIAQLLAQAGADAIQVRFHCHGNLVGLWPEQLLYPEPMEGRPAEADWSRGGRGAYLPIAAAIREVVDIPVMGVGRLDASIGEEALAKGQIDLVGMTRRLVADPQLPNKLMAERERDIAPCTACLCCLDDVGRGEPVRCRINGHLGLDQKRVTAPAARLEHVVVVGSGPSGLEAARVAAVKGHRVTLVSRDRRLGGLMRLAAMVKGQEIEELDAIVDYYGRQLADLGVTLRLGRPATPERVAALSPDRLILATGGVPSAPEIPGLDECRKVVRSADLMETARRALGFVGPETLRRLSRWWMPIGRRVVVIGGAIHGCELAEFLTRRGREVTLVHPGDPAELGDGLTAMAKAALFPWLVRRGVEILVGVHCDRIADEGLTLSLPEGATRRLEADHFVTAWPLEPDPEIEDRYLGVSPVVERVGDCREPGLILTAVESGARIFAEGAD
jgi:2,4-dienoyl-CoA reductase (NADPH2)